MEWTDGRVRGFITSVLRSGFRRWPAKYEVLNASKTEKKINTATGRLAQHYRCNKCGEEFTKKDVEVDHKNPVVDVENGFESWDTFIDRLYCPPDHLQVLCKDCHKDKTKEEKQQRKKKNAD